MRSFRRRGGASRFGKTIETSTSEAATAGMAGPMRSRMPETIYQGIVRCIIAASSRAGPYHSIRGNPMQPGVSFSARPLDCRRRHSLVD